MLVQGFMNKVSLSWPPDSNLLGVLLLIIWCTSHRLLLEIASFQWNPKFVGRLSFFTRPILYFHVLGIFKIVCLDVFDQWIFPIEWIYSWIYWFGGVQGCWKLQWVCKSSRIRTIYWQVANLSDTVESELYSVFTYYNIKKSRSQCFADYHGYGGLI